VVDAVAIRPIRVVLRDSAASSSSGSKPTCGKYLARKMARPGESAKNAASSSPALGGERRPLEHAEPGGTGQVGRIGQLPGGLVVPDAGQERGEVGMLTVYAHSSWSACHPGV
jgi:hypothetical protein